MGIATAIAHPNIALVKYWGKRDLALNLPAVPSVSMTLAGFKTETTVHWGAQQDEVTVAGATAPEPFARRALKFLDLIHPNRPPCAVQTRNNFPTAAGLASSSSGFAALALAGLAASDTTYSNASASVLARRGSGSACRSLWGGYVAWGLGELKDGSDCHGTPIASADHWDLAMVIAVVSDQKKAISSTEAMLQTGNTSPLYTPFVTQAPNDVSEATDAILKRDLERLGQTMESSTFKMHATMQTAQPPILYWHPQTVACIQTVFELRRSGISAWLTMDAGPNVKVLCDTKDAADVQKALQVHVLATHVLPAGPAPTVKRHD